MNKFITKIVGAALGLTLAIGVGVAVGVNKSEAMMVRATDTTFLPSDFTATENNNYSLTKGSITISVTASTVTAEQIRVFKGKTLTVSSTDDITSVVFTCTVNGADKYGPGCFTTASGYTYESDGPTGTWTGTSNSIVFTAESNQVRCTSIVVSYTGTASNKIASISSVALSSSTESVTSKAEITATATYTSVNGGTPDESIVWTSSNTSVATIASTSTYGVAKITIKAVGICTFTASNTESPSSQGYISATSSSFTIYGGESINIIGSEFPKADGKSGNSYADYTGTRTINYYRITADCVMKASYSTNYYLQFKSSSNVGVLYNDSPFTHGIALIRADYYDNSSAITIKFSEDTPNPSTGVDANTVTIDKTTYFIPKTAGTYKYFKATGTGNTEKVTSLKIMTGEPAALDFANTYLAAFNCGTGTGASAPTYNANYSAAKLESLYAALSTASKNLLKSAAENHTESYGTDKMKEFGQRYYLIVTNHGSSYDIMSVFSSGSLNINSQKAVNNTHIIVLIVITAITLVAVSSYFVIRRRREN